MKLLIVGDSGLVRLGAVSKLPSQPCLCKRWLPAMLH